MLDVPRPAPVACAGTTRRYVPALDVETWPKETDGARNRYFRDIPLPGLEDGPSGYRGPRSAKIVGISYRQLDHWTTTGLVRAVGARRRRVGLAAALQLRGHRPAQGHQELLDAGVSLQRIRRALDFVRDRGLDLRKVTLLSDSARKVYALDDTQQVIDLLQRGQGVFAIAVMPVVAELEADVRALSAERASPPVVRPLHQEHAV